MTPIRIQRSRQHKTVNPNGLPIVYVGRPSHWGNHYIVGKTIVHYGLIKNNKMAAELYKEWIEAGGLKEFNLDINKLKGKNLSCWCPIHESCHADILLKLANE